MVVCKYNDMDLHFDEVSHDVSFIKEQFNAAGVRNCIVLAVAKDSLSVSVAEMPMDQLVYFRDMLDEAIAKESSPNDK